LLPHEVGFSSTLREMSAIHKTLLCRGNVLRMESQTTLWWLIDNSARPHPDASGVADSGAG
jgi:hypothetical protein